MRRKHMAKRVSRKIFKKGAKKVHHLNGANHVMRGGIRL